MSRQEPLYEWADEVATHFPGLSKPQAKVLAYWTYGIVLARSCTLPAVANALSPLLGKSFNTVRQRLREWYKEAPKKAGPPRRELDVTTCFVPLLAWILKAWPAARVALALDATTLSERLTVLSLSLVYRGTAIPVAWKILRGNKRHAWRPEWCRLLKWFAGQVDPSWEVIVLTDRGLYARWLFQKIVRLGWHPMMRVARSGKFLPDGWKKSKAFRKFVPRAGQVWQGRGTAFPRRPQRRLVCTLLACRAEGHKDGWYILTDLPPQAANAAWYGLRMWIEHGFKQFKSSGWDWQKTRITDPVRAGRMWLALSVAVLWVVAVGGAHDHTADRQETMPEMPATDVRRRGPESDQAKRLVSVLKQGIALVLAALLSGQLARPGTWYPEPWPIVADGIQCQSHEHPP